MMRGVMMVVATLAASTPQPNRLQQTSADFIQRYLREWSSPTPQALQYMEAIYPEHVSFYGEQLSHLALMNLKRKFALRWPERTYTVRTESILVVCHTQHVCTAETLYDWHYRNRQMLSRGTATLKLELQDGKIILLETGSVLTQSATTLVQVPAPPDPLAIPADTLTPKDIPPLRADFEAHDRDSHWITDWMQQTRVFAGQGVYTGAVEEQSAPGPDGVMHTFNIETEGGPVACINPRVADPLTVGEKVKLQGKVGLFIIESMFLNQCSIEPVG